MVVVGRERPQAEGEEVPGAPETADGGQTARTVAKVRANQHRDPVSVVEGASVTLQVCFERREALEARLGRGGYVVGAMWDEGSAVHAMRRFGGTTLAWRFGDG